MRSSAGTRSVTLIRWRRDNGLDLLLRVVFAIGISDEREAAPRALRTTRSSAAFADRLSGDDIDLRADLIVAQLLGLGAALAVDRTGPTASSDPTRSPTSTPRASSR